MMRLTCALLMTAILTRGSGAAVTPEGQMVVTDPVWSEEPAEHNTFPTTDLTELRIVNGPDELWIEIPFRSDWSGLQLHVLLETRFDAGGATTDPFGQPVTYVHALRPDYVVTCKYSSNDHGDCRRWNQSAGRWEWYDPASGTYSMLPDLTNIVPLWTDKGASLYSLRIPWGPFGVRPDSLLAAVYLTQQDGVKRSAFDSVPSDATLDLDFDYNNPGPGDWDITLGPVALSAWSPVYHVRTEFPAAPQLLAVAVAPGTVGGGGSFLLTADVVDMGDGIGAVVADLESLGGSMDEPLFDDGDPAHGDVAAGDGRYSLLWTVPEYSLGGQHALEVRAYDSFDLQHASGGCTVTILPPTPLLHAEDAVGDDHGPNQPGVMGMYYTYPTSGGFVPGAFDLTSLDVRRVRANAAGQLKDWLAFTVGIRDLRGPGDPDYADWNPYFAELSIEKIDILIDARAGGTTKSLPDRGAAYVDWDAWDYAIIIDGWVKAVIPYAGSDLLEDWLANARAGDQDILLVGDAPGNAVTALVDPAIVGNPSDAMIRSWDICVQIASHDGGGFEVFGGIRRVNASTSEWNFGGGDNSSLDANLLDLLLVPGAACAPGRPQEDLLDYDSDEAKDRLAQGLTPVAIAATSQPVSAVGPAPTRGGTLAQNAPNPFNPGTVIGFSLPAPAAATLRVFDLSGRLVRTLLAGKALDAGEHEVIWSGDDEQGRPVASGSYYYRLEAAGFTATARAVLLK